MFGGFLSHPLHPSDTFYGTGETFLFLLHPRFKVRCADIPECTSPTSSDTLSLVRNDLLSAQFIVLSLWALISVLMSSSLWCLTLWACLTHRLPVCLSLSASVGPVKTLSSLKETSTPLPSVVEGTNQMYTDHCTFTAALFHSGFWLVRTCWFIFPNGSCNSSAASDHRCISMLHSNTFSFLK